MFGIKKILLSGIVIIIFSISCYSQGEFSTSREPDRYNINSIGIKLNSNGFGAVYSFQQRKHYRMRRVVEAEYNYVKDIKEVKVINEQFQLLNRKGFVFGKLFSVHNLKAGYGYSRMIFEKRDNNSVSIHLLGTIGLSINICKPIYYEKYNLEDKEIIYEKFDAEHLDDNYNIIGKGPITLGLNEIKIRPGIYAKFGLEFDFSQDIMQTSVLSAGGVIEGLFPKIEIMAGNGRYIMPSLYVMYSFGKKYNSKLSREFRREQRKQK